VNRQNKFGPISRLRKLNMSGLSKTLIHGYKGEIKNREKVQKGTRFGQSLNETEQRGEKSILINFQVLFPF